LGRPFVRGSRERKSPRGSRSKAPVGGLGNNVLPSASYTTVMYSERNKTMFCQLNVTDGGFI